MFCPRLADPRIVERFFCCEALTCERPENQKTKQKITNQGSANRGSVSRSPRMSQKQMVGMVRALWGPQGAKFGQHAFRERRNRPQNKTHKHDLLPSLGVTFKNEKGPRNGSPGHGFECRPLNWLSFFAENPFPATPGPGEAQKIPKVAPKKKKL